LFEELGGFPDLPILEDFEFVRRVRRCGRVLTVPERIVTSARRWQTLGFFRTTVRNQVIVAGYRLGIDPRKLSGLYRREHAG
jgi:hypothetical protein